MEYRYKLRIATTESVKAMYSEYIKRKSDELAEHSADAHYSSMDFGDMISPSKIPPSDRGKSESVSSA